MMPAKRAWIHNTEKILPYETRITVCVDERYEPSFREALLKMLTRFNEE